MRRFFVQEIEAKDGLCTIRGSEARHMARVLRMGRGDRFILMDGKGARFLAVIESAGRREVLVTLEEPLPQPLPSPVEITLCQALLKSRAMDYVMEKTSELGLHRILPFSSERTVVRLNEERFANKKQHWHELARSAAKQSDRKTPMEIGPLSSFEELVESCRAEDALKVILWEEETATDLKGVLRRSPPFTPSPPASPEAKPMADGRERWRAGQTLPPEGEGKACPVLDTGVGVMKFIGVVGPEGGFSEQEVRAAEKAGFVSVSLGQRVLRAETAAVAIVAIVQYEWGDLSLRHPPKPGA